MRSPLVRTTDETTAALGTQLGRDGSAPTTGSGMAPDARRLCADLLREVVEPLGVDSAVLYAPTSSTSLVAVCGMGSPNLRPAAAFLAQDAACAAMNSKLCIVTPVATDASPCDVVAIPCKVAGVVAAVVVAQVPSSHRGSPVVDHESPALLTLGLAVDRYRVHLTLEEVRADAEAVRRQLDAYAVDLRSTYLAERDRSVELAGALDELTVTYESTVRGLAIAVEAKDEYTGGHLHRVSRYGMAITEVVAPEHTGDPQFEYGFLLHDVGKLVIPDAVLMKDGPLDEDEWEMMRGHPEAGRTILDQIPFLSVANEIVHCHHERWDGEGYPRGLKGEEIPLGARIFPLADVFDAMTTTRPYRKALSVQEARRELQRGSGTQFYPQAVDAFSSISLDTLELVRTGSRPDYAL
jgi:HD-GYP domain-containing protein (c-di-GMP phosphodiesterase class II)